MKCEKCFASWTISDLGTRQIKFCPFCGIEIKEKEPTGFANISDCFRYLKKKYSHTIFYESKKVLSYISDYMPALAVEKRILRVALEAGVYKQLIDDAGMVISLNIEKAKYILVNDYGLSDKWACEAVNWIVDAFDVQIKSHAPVQKKKTEQITTKLANNDNDDLLNKIATSQPQFGRDSRGSYQYRGQSDKNGIPDGIGELKYEYGGTYIGNFMNGLLTGKGKWIGTHGIFEGMFKDGKQIEGHGVLIDEKGDKYEGNFRKGLRKHGVITVTRKGEVPVNEKYENGHPLFYF